MRLKNLPGYLLLVTGLRGNDELGFRLVTTLSKLLMPRYQFTWPQIAWFENPFLLGTLRKFGEEHGFNAHRRFTLMQLLRLVAEVPGDTAECGAFKGCGSHIILQASRDAHFERTHHVFDSFEGLSPPSGRDGSYWSQGDLSIGEHVVRANLGEFDRVTMYKGWIPIRFDEVSSASFAFVHVDVDLHQPTKDSIEFFYPRLSPGAIFVCDDYGLTTCPGATVAIDEYLADKPEKMVALAAGGGFFIKGCVTAAAPRP